MAEDRKTFKIKDGHLGEVKIADEVVAIIAGLAATEVEGVSSMAGNITNEHISGFGIRPFGNCITMEEFQYFVVADQLHKEQLALKAAQIVPEERF